MKMTQNANYKQLQKNEFARISREKELESLLERYKPLIYSMARKYSIICQSDVDDFVQEGYILLNKLIDKVDYARNFDAYFKRSMINEMINLYRKQRRNRSESCISLNEDAMEYNEDAQQFEIHSTNSYDNPESHILDKDALEEFELAKKILSKDEQKAISLYLHGYNGFEISEALGKTYTNTGVIIHRARKKMRKYYLYALS